MTAFAIPSVPGFWPDYYACLNNQESIVETIIRMIKHSASDFPSTTLSDIKIISHSSEGQLVRIYPTILDKDGNVHNFGPESGDNVGSSS